MEYFGFQWHITDACDQRCRHCYIYAEDASAAAGQASWDEMLTVLERIHSFGRRFGRQPYLYITGGDPLLHPSFWRFAELLAAEKLPYAILGNPYHLTKTVCARLRETGCREYQMSLDGLKQTHDWMRRQGSFEETLDRLPMLHDAGLYTIIMSTVSAANLNEIVPLMEMLASRSVDLYAFARFCNTGSTGGNGLGPAQYRKLLDACWHLAERLPEMGSSMRLSFKDHLWTLYNYEEGRFQIPRGAVAGMVYGGCHCGGGHLTILPDGAVYACRRVKSPIGNVLQESLVDIWLGDGAEAYRDFSRFQKCRSCELWAWCRGCPAVAAAEHGSFYAPDPQCWKEAGLEEENAGQGSFMGRERTKKATT